MTAKKRSIAGGGNVILNTGDQNVVNNENVAVHGMQVDNRELSAALAMGWGTKYGMPH